MNPWDNDPVVGGKTSTPEEFAQVYGPAAERASKVLGVDSKTILGQWGLETGWGKSIVPGTNNLGNIKDFSGSGVGATDNMTGSKDKYRAYASPDAFADDYASLIQRKYPNAVGAKDPLAFATALKSGGYAEDPNYVNKVVQTSRMAGGTNPVVAAVGKAVNAVIPSAQAAQGNPWDNDPVVEPSAATAQPDQGAAFGVYPNARRQAKNNTPNASDAIVMGALRGGKDVLDTGAEIVSRLGGADEAARIKAQNDAGKAQFQQEYGNSGLAGAARTGGNIIATLPVGGALAAPVRAVAPFVGGAAPVVNRLANALSSSGMSVGEGGGAAGNMLLRMAGGGATGGASAGLVNPDSASTGMVLGAALPPVVRVVGGAGGAVGGAARGVRDMATTAGQQRIAENILRSSATNPESAAAFLARARTEVPGSVPTMGQVANDPGLAQLERTMLNNPEIAPGLQQRFAEQRAARASAIDDIAGRGTYYDDIKAGRAQFAKEDYDRALNTPIDPQVAEEMAPQIADLVQRPSIKSAIVDAKRLAAETGENIGDMGSVRGLDWVKKALDNKISMAGSPGSGIGKADLKALNQTKQDLMATIEQLSPGYKEANDNFAAMSRQINSMDVARNLDKSYTPVAANFGASAKEQGNQYMKALTQAQESVKKSTGMDRPLSQVMNTSDISALEGVGRDLARKQYAESAGMATGSPTAQNIMSQQLISRIMEGAGVSPSFTAAAANNTVLNTALRPIEFAGKLAAPKVYNRLAELALDPQKAAIALRSMGPEEAQAALSQLPPNRLLMLAGALRQGAYRAAPVLAASPSNP